MWDNGMWRLTPWSTMKPGGLWWGVAAQGTLMGPPARPCALGPAPVPRASTEPG